MLDDLQSLIDGFHQTVEVLAPTAVIAMIAAGVYLALRVFLVLVAIFGNVDQRKSALRVLKLILKRGKSQPPGSGTT